MWNPELKSQAWLGVQLEFRLGNGVAAVPSAGPCQIGFGLGTGVAAVFGDGHTIVPGLGPDVDVLLQHPLQQLQ